MIKFVGKYKLRNVCSHCGYVDKHDPYDSRGDHQEPRVCASCGHAGNYRSRDDWKVYSVRWVGWPWSGRYEVSPVHKKEPEQ